jgi:hypothetical protein
MAQVQTEVIASGNNSYYVVWETSSDEILAQEFSATGVSITGPVDLADTFVSPSPFAATVNPANGDLELAYTAFTPSSLFYASFTPSLNFVTSLSLGSTFTDPAITAFADGNSIITYLQPTGTVPFTGNLFAAGISASGSFTPFGEIAEIVSQAPPGGGQASLATLSSGNAVIAYNNDFELQYTIINEQGVTQTSGFAENVLSEAPPAAAALTSGGFVLVSSDADDGGALVAEVFDSNGEVIRNQFLVDKNSSSNPTVTPTPQGGFIIAWSDNVSGQSFEQQYDPTGNLVGSAVVLPTTTTFVSSATTLSDGQTAFGFKDQTMFGGNPNAVYESVLDTRTSVSDAATGGSFLGGGTGDFLLASVAPANTAAGGIVTLDVLSNGVVSQIGQLGTDWSTDLSANFSGSGMEGLLAHQTVGANETYFIFQMGQSGLGSETNIGTWGTGWQAVGSGNFAGVSAPPDVLMQLVSGGFDTLQVAFIGANNAQTGVEQVGVLPSTVQAVGAGNFNGSGTDEILLKSQVGGGNIELEVLNITNGSVTPIGTWGSNWTVDGVGSFGGAGTVGILMEEDTSAGRTLAIAAVQNNTIQSITNSGPIGYNLVIDGIGDFAGNGTSDIAAHFATATSATGPTTTDAWLQVQNNAVVGGLHTAGITGPNFLPR